MLNLLHVFFFLKLIIRNANTSRVIVEVKLVIYIFILFSYFCKFIEQIPLNCFISAILMQNNYNLYTNKPL